jgi:hypothetical protein
MGMSDFHGDGDEGESIATIHRAIELGTTFLDTGPETTSTIGTWNWNAGQLG